MSRIALPNLRIGGLRQFSFGDVIYDRANLYPNLDLDFATNKNLTDNKSGKTSLVSFSRSAASSPGTYVDSQGLVKKAAVNLALYSEEFDQWTLSSAGTGTAPDVKVNQVDSPDGKQTADKIVFDLNGGTSSGDNSFIYRTYSGIANQTYTLSAWIRTESGTANIFLDSDSNNSQIITDTTEWTRFSTTSTGALTGTRTIRIGLRGSFGTSDSATIYIWGAQLEETDPALMGPSAYIKTTSQTLCAPRFDHEPTSGNLTTNLMLYSEMLDNTSVWTQLSSPTVTANNDTAPDGTETADDITDPSTSYSGIQQAFTGISGVQYATSLYLKKISVAPTSYPAIQLARGDGTLTTIIINLQTGAINTLVGGSRVAPDSYSAVSDGDYWRITSVTTSAGSSMSYTLYPAFSLNGTSATATATGTVTAWGGQIEASSSAGTYVRTLGETRSISDATAESLGLLVEEQRTNDIDYSHDTTTANYGTTNITDTINQAVSPDGQNTAAKIEINASAGNRTFRYRTLSSSASTTYTVSFWVKNIDMPAFGMIIFSIDGGGAFTQISGLNYTSQVNGTEWSRVTHTFTSIASTAKLEVQFLRDQGTTGNSFYYWGGQLEVGSFATSTIIREGATPTRYADLAAIQDEDYSVTYLLSYSESFDIGWTTSGLEPVTPNATTAPDGTNTADYIEQQSGNTSAGVIYRFPTVSSSGTNVFSVYAKAAEKGWIRLHHNPSSGPFAYFNLTTCEIGTRGNGAISSAIENVGNGWCRVSMVYTHVSTSGLTIYLADADNSSTVTDSGGVYLWGASHTQTEYPVDYVSTRNLLTDSQDFERSSWTKYGIGGGVAPAIVSDSKYAPDGTDTGTEITFSAPSSGDQSFMTHSFASISGVQYVGSFYVRGEGSNIGKTILFRHAATSGYQTVTLTANWQRITRQETAGVTGTRTIDIGLRPGINGTSPDTVTALLWGAQIEPGSTATEYYRTYDVVGKNYNWFEPTEGTTYFEGKSPLLPSFTNPRFAVFSDGSGNNVIESYITQNSSVSVSSALRVNVGGVQQALITRTGTNADQFRSVVTGFKQDDFVVTTEGNAVTTDSSGTIPIVSELEIGALLGTNVVNGHIKRLIYFPRRIKDSNLVLMTE